MGVAARPRDGRRGRRALRGAVAGFLVALNAVLAAGWAEAGEDAGRTTLSNAGIRFEVVEAPYVVLRRVGVEAVVVDHRAVDDEVLRGHKAGYSGLAALRRGESGDNLFVPSYAGLNFEHIHDGTTQAREVLFEPRNVPVELRRIDEHTVELYQRPTPHWGLESCQRFSMLPDGAIEMTFECVARGDTFANGYIGLFWASYIDRPESKAIRFVGRPEEGEAHPRPLSTISPSHGVDAVHVGAEDRREFNHDADFPLTLVFQRAPDRYVEPWYFGVSHGMAYAQVFRAVDQVRFAQSPTGGGNGNPAWDFEVFFPAEPPGRVHRLVMRAVYSRYESFEGVRGLIEPHRKALEGQRP